MMFWSCLFYTMLTVLAWNSMEVSFVTASSGYESDQLALLAIKDEIRDDPLGSLSSWNSSVHFCDWNGVICSHHQPNQRVVILDLSNKKLDGTLSPQIGNLSFLRTVLLNNNNFHGKIPPEIGRLFSLRSLSLSNNSFSGDIPANLSHLSNLRLLALARNNLLGGIPVEITSLSKLTVLDLANNNLNGSIPSSLGNLSFIANLSLGYNGLTGTIPDDLCRIQSLNVFTVGSNNLNGIVPSCLYNISSIRIFSVTRNQLHGRLPLDIGLTLPNIQELHMGGNNFRGIIPLSLPNASRLERLDLSENQFTGHMLKDLGRLRHLRELSLWSNKFGGDLNFIASLTNCSNLQWFSIHNNSFIGSVPNSLGNLSAKILHLHLSHNQLHGGFPAGLRNLVNLHEFEIDHNHLTGEIPEFIGMFPQMHHLWLNGNLFSGKIPNSFYNSTRLEILFLCENELHGGIPLSLVNCQNLIRLDLSDNKLNGTIPRQFIGLLSVKYVLNLSNNALTGTLPSEVGNLTSLQRFDISSNRLSGPIPNTLGNCLTLEYLNMKNNFFKGIIPPSLSVLKGLSFIDLSHNKLSGEIPEKLQDLTLLTYLNVSYNELEGQIPVDGVFAGTIIVSVDGNTKLCGGMTGLKLPPCNIQSSRKTLEPMFLKVAIPLMCLCVFMVVLVLFLRCRRKRKSREKSFLPSLSGHRHMRISYTELCRATNSFSPKNLIGTGSYGSVYKGVLDQVKTIIAVKVLNLQVRGASKSFMSECNALRHIQHRNILKIITSCSSLDHIGNDFKALVFEFMRNGSLEEWLHPKGNEQHELRNLNFLQRLDVAIDIASALDYLHHDCQPAIVHCDLKPSNVLLDDDMTAHVADFGLARMFSTSPPNSSQIHDSSLAVKGSIGYIAPEYGTGGEVSTQGDIYSYGILLLEMFTRKRPTDSIFQDGLNLHVFAKLALPENLKNIVDPRICHEFIDEAVIIENKIHRGVGIQECLVAVIALGVRCSSESPVERTGMGEVVNELYNIRNMYV